MPDLLDPARLDAVGAVGPARRADRTTSHDAWLAGSVPDIRGVALIAVGGLGRGEPAPFGDLDLVLVHSGSVTGVDVAEVAEKIWYPIWDAGIALDHSVRTIAEAVEVAAHDLPAAIGLLDARFVAGDRAVGAQLRTAARAAWRGDAARRLPELREDVARRWEQRGELAFLLEPDLKECRGGLRDLTVLRAIAATQIAEPPWPALRAPARTLLDVRDMLQLVTGRRIDRLLMQEQGIVARRLGCTDADQLLRSVADAARGIAYAGEETWRGVDAWLVSRRRWPVRRRATVRRPLADGVVEQDGEVVLARAAQPRTDPALVLRVARAAARTGLPIAPHTLCRLAEEAAPIPDPWPAGLRDAWVALLGSGPGLVAAWEAIDRYGLVERLLPEWAGVRSLPQHNPLHRWTVDRHLVETVVGAAGRTSSVARPDLLLIAAVLHDIGKGTAADHSIRGAQMSVAITTRMGLAPGDAQRVCDLVALHLLLPDSATRRDPDDPATVRSVTEQVVDTEMLDLLHALTVADATASGPAAWSEWKADLVTDLVRRTRALLHGAALPPPWRPDPDVVARAVTDGAAVVVSGGEIALAVRGRADLLSLAAGVASLHRLDVRAARSSVGTEPGSDPAGRVVVLTLEVQPRFGSPPDPARVRADLHRALAGTLALADRVGERERAYPDVAGAPEPRLLWFDDEATDATVLELRAADSPGLLFRVAAALEADGPPIRAARVETYGGWAVDAFYLDGGVSPGAARARLSALVLAAAQTGS